MYKQDDLIQDTNVLLQILEANTSNLFQDQSEIDTLKNKYGKLAVNGLTLEEYVEFKNKVVQTKKATSVDYQAILEGTFVGAEEDKDEKIAQAQYRLIRDLVAFDKTNVTEDTADTAGGIFDVSDEDIDAFMSANNIPDNLKDKLQEIIEARKETRRQNFLGTTNENSNTPEEIQNILARHDKRHGTDILGGNPTDIDAFIDTWGFSANDLEQAQEIIQKVVSNYKIADKSDAYKKEESLLAENNLLKVTHCGKQTIDLTNADDLHAYLIQTLFGDTDTLNGIQAQQLHNAKTVIESVFGNRTDVTPDEFIRKLGNVQTGDITTESIKNLMQMRGEQPSEIPPTETPTQPSLLRDKFAAYEAQEQGYRQNDIVQDPNVLKKILQDNINQDSQTDDEIKELNDKFNELTADSTFSFANYEEFMKLVDQTRLASSPAPTPSEKEARLLTNNNLVVQKSGGPHIDLTDKANNKENLENYLKSTTGSTDQDLIDATIKAIKDVFGADNNVKLDKFITALSGGTGDITSESLRAFIESVPSDKEEDLLRNHFVLTQKRNGQLLIDFTNKANNKEKLENYLKSTTGSTDQNLIDETINTIGSVFGNRTDVTLDAFITALGGGTNQVTIESLRDFIAKK